MNKISKLSIIIPVFNEAKTIKSIVDRVFQVNLGKIKKEIIVVNDGSKDDTLSQLKRLKKIYPIKIVSYSKNLGKSCALRIGFTKATGDVITIQDGDLEYDPNDFVPMLKKMLEDGVKVVYGSRRLNKKNVQYSGLSFYVGGIFLTYMVNILYGGRITDESTCYKMFESKLLKSIKLESKRFEFCPEVTAKVLRQGVDIFEVPIFYSPRTNNQGKKIKLRDFFEAVWALIKYRFV